MKPLIEQFSRDRLEMIANCEGFDDSVFYPKSSEVAQLAQIALAVMDAKPVAYTDKQELSFYHKHTDMWKEPYGFGQDVELYTTPPAVSMPNYPVIPDGWIKCSERMPEFGACVLITDGEIVAMSSRSKLQELGRNPWQTTYQAGGEWNTPGEITHWMPLPAAPAPGGGRETTPPTDG